jgi:nucleoside-diphosphate-sugar epimerase
MKHIHCGVIGAGGYLGQQLTHHIHKYALPIEVIPYNRKHQKFSTDKSALQNYEVLLNLGTPNEIFARQGGATAQKAIEKWSNHLEVAIRLSKPSHVVHFSTFHIFGNLESAMDDNSPTVGGNAYGDLHLECLEVVKRKTSEFGIPLSIVIPSNIYGSISPNLTARTDLILNLAIEKLRTNEPLVLKSNGSGLRDFLWIEDALLAFCAIISQKPSTQYETIVVASEMTTSVRNAIETLFSVLGRGTFESWCNVGSISEKIVPFSFACKKLKTIMGDWHPKSVFSAASSQKVILNSNEKLIL